MDSCTVEQRHQVLLPTGRYTQSEHTAHTPHAQGHSLHDSVYWKHTRPPPPPTPHSLVVIWRDRKTPVSFDYPRGNKPHRVNNSLGASTRKLLRPRPIVLSYCTMIPTATLRCPTPTATLHMSGNATHTHHNKKEKKKQNQDRQTKARQSQHNRTSDLFFRFNTGSSLAMTWLATHSTCVPPLMVQMAFT